MHGKRLGQVNDHDEADSVTTEQGPNTQVKQVCRTRAYEHSHRQEPREQTL